MDFWLSDFDDFIILFRIRMVRKLPIEPIIMSKVAMKMPRYLRFSLPMWGSRFGSSTKSSSSIVILNVSGLLIALLLAVMTGR